MATSTTRLGLRRPDAGDVVNYEKDLNENFDKLDAAAGADLVNSSNRPTTGLYGGREIQEANTGNFGIYDDTGTPGWVFPSAPVVASLAEILLPYEGQIVYCTTDELLYKRRSEAWVGFAALGGFSAATLHESRYFQGTSSIQSIPNVTDTKLRFPTAVYESDDVTPSGTGNEQFTLNRAGLWVLSAGVRFPSATAGERHLFMSLSTNLADLTARIAGDTNGVSTVSTLCVSTEVRVTAGTPFHVGVYQSSGAARSLSISGQSIFMSATWLRP